MDCVDLSVEVGEIFSVVETYELDCSVVEVGIELDISDDVDDEMELVVMINNVDCVDISVKVGVMFSDIDMNELICSVIDVGIESDVSNDADDEIKLVVLI